jgi:DNA polymerase I-like protein with 3'-5' exonuclease and polymerase domains
VVAQTIELPNIRKFFVPDPGMTMIEGDLKGADAYAVAWDSGDEALKEKLRECERTGIKLHTLNARSIFGDPVTPHAYAKAKIGVHAVDYGCKSRTLAGHLNCRQHEADAFINGWFRAHPKIKAWHERIENQLYRTRSVSNAWGYKRYYFDRVEGLLPEALAWIGQSNTAITINKGMIRVKRELPWVQLLMQVHDSVLAQVPTNRLEETLPLFHRALSVTVPYPDPLTIPVEIKHSPVSWGDMEEWKVAA